MTEVIKSCTAQPNGYPPRFYVPKELAPWNVPYPDYNPPYYVANSVLANDAMLVDGGWADPENIRTIDFSERISYEGPIQFDDEHGRPLNPRLRTGIAGRGLLGKWGPNFAADPIVTRINPDTGILEMAVIRRADTGELAIPGGMVDAGETVSDTLGREFNEETGAIMDMTGATLVYRGYVDDPRNTDNAWIETTAMHRHLSPTEARLFTLGQPKDAEEIRQVCWMPINEENLRNMYANHGELVGCALTISNLGLEQAD